MTVTQPSAIRYLPRPAPILSADDTISYACSVMRAHHLGALAVAAEGRVIGLIREDDLLEPLSKDPVAAAALRIGDFAVGDPVTIPASAPPDQAMRALQWTQSPALPVVEESGQYRGMITRQELIGFWTGSVKPPRIGGMATPFGVYLTGGGARGGVGDLALATTGALLGLFMVAVGWALSSGASVIEARTRWPVTAILASVPDGRFNWIDLILIGVRLGVFLALFGLIRLTPLAGYHAGEHQTVWAIERDEPLTPDVVRRMPRPHPRCGTNLVVGLMIFMTLRDWSPEGALIITLLMWRRLGYYVQLLLSTRPASRKQIESGIKAGKQVLERYRTDPDLGRSVSAWRYVWNLGLFQVFIGMYVVMTLLGTILKVRLF